MTILFHILSGQSLQNYISAKIINPNLNFYLYTKESKNSLNVHIEVLGEVYKSVQIDSWNYSSVYQQVTKIIEQLPNDKLLLNFTGGNKIISQAAFNSFKDKNHDCIYINSQENEYIYFTHSSKSESVETSKISVKGDISETLKLNGQNIKFADNIETEARQKLRLFLTTNYKEYSKFILQFARKWDSKSPLINNLKLISDGNYKNSFIKYEDNSSKIYFVKNGKEELNITENGKELLEYLNGKWFETACFLKLKDLNYFPEIYQNATLDKLNKASDNKYEDKNEFDIITMKGIYPIIFECKAGGLRTEYIDKLIAFKQTYLGRYSSVYFITYFPINNNNEYEVLLNEKLSESKITALRFSNINKTLVKEFQKQSNLR